MRSQESERLHCQRSSDSVFYTLQFQTVIMIPFQTVFTYLRLEPTFIVIVYVSCSCKLQFKITLVPSIPAAYGKFWIIGCMSSVIVNTLSRVGLVLSALLHLFHFIFPTKRHPKHENVIKFIIYHGKYQL